MRIYGGLAMAKRERTETEATRSPVDGELGIRDLISYKVSRTAGLMSRGAALQYRREFDVSLGEWRAIALLAATPGLSLIQLSREAGLDKAQMSRVASFLTRRGLLTRKQAPGGGRAISLELSNEGWATYRGLIAAAGRRDELFRAALTEEELAALERALKALSRAARGLIIAQEK